MATAFLDEGFAEEALPFGMLASGGRYLVHASGDLIASISVNYGLEPAFLFGDVFTSKFACHL